jgi:hypothetical protein
MSAASAELAVIASVAAARIIVFMTNPRPPKSHPKFRRPRTNHSGPKGNWTETDFLFISQE